ncbi:hypothetical protein ACLH3T_002430, partial [Flavobacterium psychrophilum]
KTILILLIFFSSMIYSQNIKEYNGKYSIQGVSRFNDYGIASYNFIENKDSERIKNGKFIFKGSRLSIDGQFKNGFRDGLWKIKYTNNHPYYEKYTIVLLAFYKQGKLDGNCTYIKSLNSGKLILEKSSAFFKENVLIGLYTFDKYFDDHKAPKRIIIKYKQDLNGQLDGEYKTEFRQECCDNLGQIEDVINYEKGEMKYRLCREKQDGKIYYKFENGQYTKSLENKSSKNIFSSTWDVYIGCDFWIGGNGNQTYNGIANNPLYAFTEGINEEGFISINERTNL